MSKKSRRALPIPRLTFRTKSDAEGEQIEQSLSAIFQDEQGSIPDLKTFEHRRRSRVFIGVAVAVVICAFLLMFAWVGFRFFKPFQGTSTQGFQISILGPQEVVLGQESTYVIQWKNISSAPLGSAAIHMSFPTDFAMTGRQPEPVNGGWDWRLGSIPFGGGGSITIKGIFTGSLGTRTGIQAVGTYRPAAFNSDFESLSSLDLEYRGTVLEGALEFPEKILPGDRLRIAYHIHHSGLEPLSHLEARLLLPEGFVREASSTDSQLDGRMWRVSLPSLAPNASTTISVSGSFAAGVHGTLPIQAEIGHLAADGAFQTALKTESSVVVLAGDLSLHVSVNGASQPHSVSAGDSLRVAIGYENTSNEEIHNVIIRFRLEPIVATGTSVSVPSSVTSWVNWSQLEDASSGTRKGNVLTWDASRLGVLARLTPNADGSIEFSVPVSASGTASGGFQIVAEATMASVGSTPIQRTVRTTPIPIRFRSDADIFPEIRYFSEEGAPFGTGPLPPIVGQPTTYRVTWKLAKHLHSLKGIQVSAVLPKNVVWPNVSFVKAGTIVYDSAARRVTWTLNRLPSDVNMMEVSFNVELTPSLDEAGHFANVLRETRFEATDADVDELIIRVKPGLTTDAQTDEGAKSKGIVRKN